MASQRTASTTEHNLRSPELHVRQKASQPKLLSCDQVVAHNYHARLLTFKGFTVKVHVQESGSYTAPLAMQIICQASRLRA